jgi:hypothetical protein
VQQFIDMAGAFARTPISNTIVAATAMVVDIADLKPFVTFTIQINNTGGSTGTLSAFAVLLGAG